MEDAAALLVARFIGWRRSVPPQPVKSNAPINAAKRAIRRMESTLLPTMQDAADDHAASYIGHARFQRARCELVNHNSQAGDLLAMRADPIAGFTGDPHPSPLPQGEGESSHIAAVAREVLIPSAHARHLIVVSMRHVNEGAAPVPSP